MVQLLARGMKVRSKQGVELGTVRYIRGCCVEVETPSGVAFVRRGDIFTVEHDGLTLTGRFGAPMPPSCAFHGEAIRDTGIGA